MSSLCIKHCSKVHVSSFKFKLTVEKKSENLLSSIHQKLDLNDRKSQKSYSAELLNKAQAHENV